MKMEKIFDLAKFDEYKEDNRREVKSAKGGLPNSLLEKAFQTGEYGSCR